MAKPQRCGGEPGDAVDREPDHLAQGVLGVARGAGRPRVVHRGTREPQRGHDEPQHPAVLGKGVHGIHGGARHHPVVAGIHLGVDVRHRPDRAVERPGGDPLERGVGGPVGAHPVDDVDALAARHGEHLADHLGWVLQVGVEGHDPLAPGAGQAGRDGRLVPGVGAQPDHAHLRPLASQPLQQHGGAVGGAVVDAEDLVGRAPPVRGRAQALDEQRQHRLLVVHGDHDAQVDRGGGHGARVDGPARAHRPAGAGPPRRRHPRGRPAPDG